MGLFSSKKKTYTGFQSSRLIEDEDIVDIGEQTRLQMALAKDRRVDAFDESFAEIYNSNVNGSLGVKALAYHKYAKSKYYYGVLEGYTIKEGDIDLPSIFRDFMLQKYDATVDVKYIKLGPINNQHAVYQILQDNFDYDPTTNIVGYYDDPTYLEDFKIFYTQESIDLAINPDFYNPLGLPATHGQTFTRTKDTSRKHTQWEVDTEATEDYALVTFVTLSGDTEVRSTIRIGFNEYEYSQLGLDQEDTLIPEDALMEESYFMVRYAQDEEERYFTYAYGSGGEPILDRAITGDVDPGKYLAQIYIAWDRVKFNSDTNSEAYKSSRAYCNMLGMNYSEVVDSLWDSIGKDTSEVKDIFISHRLNANSDDPLIIEYMYNFFYEMYKDSDTTKERSGFIDLKNQQVLDQSRGGISIQLKDKLTDTYVTCSSLGIRQVKGTIGAKGTYTREYQANAVEPSIFSSLTVPVIIYRHQITETTYREVIVRGLSSKMNMSSGHWNNVSNDSEDLLIPIDVDIVNKLMFKYKHELLSKSMHVMINTLKVVKKKWYQTGVFKVVSFAIGIAISVVTAGAGAPLVMTILKAIAVAVAVNVAATVVSRLLVEIGVDAGIVGAVVAVVAVIIGAYAYGKETTVASLNATDFMAIANTSFKVSNNGFVLQREKELEAFKEYQSMYEEQMEEIDQLREELGLNLRVNLDIYTLLAQSIRGPDIRLGESPISFLERTTSVDAGFMPTAVVSNFVYLTTTLPTFESFIQKRNQQYV